MEADVKTVIAFAHFGTLVINVNIGTNSSVSLSPLWIVLNILEMINVWPFSGLTIKNHIGFDLIGLIDFLHDLLIVANPISSNPVPTLESSK